MDLKGAEQETDQLGGSYNRQVSRVGCLVQDGAGRRGGTGLQIFRR